MSFCTAINCMDGRVQEPVARFLKRRFGVEYVDTITEPGPNCLLAEQEGSETVDSVLRRIRVSVEKHGSVGVAVAGHHDCAGNPAPKAEQIAQVHRAVRGLRRHFPATEVIGLWVDETWTAEELPDGAADKTSPE